MKKLLLIALLGLSILTYAAQKVYTTPKGKKYHSTKSCRTLSRSKTINEIDISKVGSRQPCQVCY